VLHTDRTHLSKPTLVILVAAAVSTIVLGTRILRAGYGADNDTWLMLGTWDHLVRTGAYLPSRPPGFPLAEASIGSLSDVGGHWLAGAASLLLGVASRVLLYTLIRPRVRSTELALLLVAVMGVAPDFVIAATTSMDYIYGLAFFLAGWVQLERRGPPWAAALVLGLAVASRLTYLPAAVLLVLLDPWRPFPTRARVKGVVALVAVSLVAYLPSISHYRGWSMFDIRRPIGQGLSGLAGRAVFKGADLLGLVGTVIVAIIVVGVITRRDRVEHQTRSGGWWLLAILAIQLAVWLWAPVDTSYLLPGLAVGLVWLSETRFIREARPLLSIAVVAVAVFGWVSFRIVDYEYANRYGNDSCGATEAVGASLHVGVDRGPALQYPSDVEARADCNRQVRARQAAG
jgi:hypothetical protein